MISCIVSTYRRLISFHASRLGLQRSLMAPACAALSCASLAMAQPVTMPPDIAPYVPSNLQTYYVGFLVTPARPVEMTTDLFRAHQSHIRAEVEAGRYKLMGPFTDSGVVRGMIVVEAQSGDEARALIAADPAVRAGVFAVEVRPAVLPDLSPVKIVYPESQAAH